jgi:hypothetical protein
MPGPLAHGEARRHEGDQHEEQDEPQSRRHCSLFGVGVLGFDPPEEAVTRVA